MKLRLVASLRNEVGKDAVEVDFEGSLTEALRVARERVPQLGSVIGVDGVPKPGVLVLVDGVDYRLLGKSIRVDSETTITIIPVNHGG